eukprot:27260_6
MTERRVEISSSSSLRMLATCSVSSTGSCSIKASFWVAPGIFVADFKTMALRCAIFSLSSLTLVACFLLVAGSDTPDSESLTDSLPPAAIDFSVVLTSRTPMRMSCLINSRSSSSSLRSAALAALAVSASCFAFLVFVHFSYSSRANLAPSRASFTFSTVRRYSDSTASQPSSASF